MLTIRELQDQLHGELQGDVVVKQWNYDIDNFDFEAQLHEIPNTSNALDRPILYMYADMISDRNRVGEKVYRPVLFIELDGDYE